MKKLITLLGLLAVPFTAMGQDLPHGADNFYKSDKVTVQKVTFDNQYKMKVAGNLFVPKDLDRSRKHAAIVVGHRWAR